MIEILGADRNAERLVVAARLDAQPKIVPTVVGADRHDLGQVAVGQAQCRCILGDPHAVSTRQHKVQRPFALLALDLELLAFEQDAIAQP